MAKIYTKTGDDGTTALFDGSRVLKCDERVDVYGDVDELNSLLGMVSSLADRELKEKIVGIQKDLFALGANLANPSFKKQKDKSQFSQDKITQLETWIDETTQIVGELKNFVLPGGSLLAGTLELARAVCRRVERKVCALDQKESLDPSFVVYLNRLSDLFFMWARWVNKKEGCQEVKW